MRRPAGMRWRTRLRRRAGLARLVLVLAPAKHRNGHQQPNHSALQQHIFTFVNAIHYGLQTPECLTTASSPGKKTRLLTSDVEAANQHCLRQYIDLTSLHEQLNILTIEARICSGANLSCKWTSSTTHNLRRKNPIRSQPSAQ